jgi:hypothetical protein
MRHYLGMGALAAVFLASACSAPPTSYSDPDPDEDEEGDPPAEADAGALPEEPTIRFAGSLEAADSGDFQSEFGLLEHRDIYAVFEVPYEGGIDFVRLDIYNAHGVLHQTMWRAISSDANAPVTAPHPEHGYAVRVMQVEQEAGSAQLKLAIPIAGTDFTQFKLIGTFDTKAWIAGGDAEPIASGSFTLVR